MPSRLFWLLRLNAPAGSRDGSSGFNAVSAFLASATTSASWLTLGQSSFNAVSAFLASATRRDARPERARCGVSMPSRLFWLLRPPPPPPYSPPPPPVSMPSRLFWLLRPCYLGRIPAAVVRFNAVSAFLASATLAWTSQWTCRSWVSMPSRLFWLLRPATPETIRRTEPFQCRLGFSGFCDDCELIVLSLSREVSMPSRLFWLLRLSSSSSVMGLIDCFNAVSAFLASATWTSPTSKTDDSGCFNAVSAFLASATWRYVSAWDDRSYSFNAVSAFLASATSQTMHAPLFTAVSMPSRLFWLLRPFRSVRRSSDSCLFQCRLGFSGFCDGYLVGRLAAVRHVSMPSRLFWLLRPLGPPVPAVQRRVSMPSRLFWLLRRACVRHPERRQPVSMPSRLFWLLRRVSIRTVDIRHTNRFNAVSAFLASATWKTSRSASMPNCVSMPSRLFWLLRLDGPLEVPGFDRLFQCRLGFSGFCDSRSRRVPAPQACRFNAVSAFLASATREIHTRAASRGFNAVSAFLASATVDVSDPAEDGDLFQCRLGFSGFCDVIRRGTASTTWYSFNAVSAFLASATCRFVDEPMPDCLFQCRLGFSGFCDAAGLPGAGAQKRVSMPSRLFWLLRQGVKITG